MPDFFQVGPALALRYHVNPLQFILVPNEPRAAFSDTISYDNARIPDEVPAGQGFEDNILRPSGYREGDAYIRPAKTIFFNNSTTNPFVIGWGTRIMRGFWVEVDLPLDWAEETYPGVYDRLEGYWDSQRVKWDQTNNGFNPDGTRKWNRIFVWSIRLEFTGPVTIVPRGVNPPPPDRKIMAAADQSDLDTNIPYSKGARRLEGNILWAKEIEGGEIALAEPAYGSFAAFFGRPLQQGEIIYCNRIWMEGKEVWNATSGVILEEFNDELVFEVYTGTADQDADPEISADLGPERTPAWRDIIYIRFTDVPLAAFGNRRPAVEAEFLREDGERIAVSGVFENLGELGGVEVDVSGVPDEADGVVFHTMDPRAHLESYAGQYNYRIIDRDPVRVKRNEVNDDLTVDVVLAGTDFVLVDAEDPVVTNELEDDTAIPNQLTITYQDKSQDYQERTQYARLPLFPIAVTASRANEQIQTDFIITAVEAVEIAWNELLRRRARQHAQNMRLMPGVLEVEEGDVIQVPTGQGTFIMDVVEATLNPDNTQDIKAEFLLPEDEAALTADTGTLRQGLLKPAYYPNVLHSLANDDIIVSNGKVITTIDPFYSGNSRVSVGFASTNIPTRLSHKFIIEPTDNAVATGFGPSNGWEVNGLCINNDYVFALNNPAQEDVKRGLVITSIDRFTYVRAELVAEMGDGVDEDVFFDCTASAANDSYLFIAARRTTIASGDVEVAEAVLIVVDLADFTPSGVSVVALNDDGFLATALDVAIVGNRVLVTSIYADSDLLLFGWKLHRYHYVDETLDTVTPSFPLGRSCVANNLVYYMPVNDAYRGDALIAVDLTNTKGAMVDPADLDDITYFDITDDDTIILQQGGQRPWTDGTYLYFLTNNCGFHPSEDILTPGYVNAPYLAKFDLETLAPVDGLDLAQYFNNLEYQVSAGAYEGGFHYIGGHSITPSSYRHGGGMILKVAVDFTHAIFYPASQFPPDNDNFPGVRLALDTTKTYENRWATKQDFEPDHGGNVGGRSLWWTFIALEDRAYQVTISPAAEGGFPSNAAVYRGSSLESLVELASIEDGNTGFQADRTMTFNAEAGGRYRIAVDGWYGPAILAGPDDETSIAHFGRGRIRIEEGDGPPANDPFAGWFTISPGAPQDAVNRYATKEVGEPDHGGNAGGHSLWWKVVVDEATTLQVTATGNGPLIVAVYTEGSPEGVSGLVEVGSDVDAGNATDDDWAAWAASI